MLILSCLYQSQQLFYRSQTVARWRNVIDKSHLIHINGRNLLLVDRVRGPMALANWDCVNSWVTKGQATQSRRWVAKMQKSKLIELDRVGRGNHSMWTVHVILLSELNPVRLEVNWQKRPIRRWFGKSMKYASHKGIGMHLLLLKMSNFLSNKTKFVPILLGFSHRNEQEGTITD